MKNAYGTYLIVTIVFTFLILFTGYICLSINQAKAFNIKNEVVKGLEIYGLENITTGETTQKFQQYITSILAEEGYRQTGDCNNYGNAYKNDGTLANNGEAAFCIEVVPVDNTVINGYYCKVTTFYQLDIPFINKIFPRVATGETKTIYKNWEYKK